MGWKNLPSWVRGCVIGIMVGLVLFFLTLFIGGNPIVGLLTGWFLFLIIVILGMLGLCGEAICRLEGFSLIQIVLLVLGWGIIGIFIGYIYGRIKSKKRKN